MPFALSTEDAQLIEAIATGLGVLATVGGIWAALWIALKGEAKRKKDNAPVLTIEAKFGGKVTLAIENAADKSTAENVEVLVVDAELHPFAVAQQAPKHASAVTPINESLKWPDGSTRVNIQPGLKRQIDVADVGGWLGPAERPVVALLRTSRQPRFDLTAPFTDERYRFPIPYFTDEMKDAGIRLRIVVVADNMNAVHHTVVIGYPWDLPWFSMAGLGHVDVALHDGFAERSLNPHDLAGGPWGDQALNHDPEQWKALDIPPAADGYAVVVGMEDGTEKEIWRSKVYDDAALSESNTKLAAHAFGPGEDSVRIQVVLDGNLMDPIEGETDGPRYAQDAGGKS